MATQTVTGIDVEALRQGLEEKDAARLASLFADDAVLQTVSHAHPPASPLRIEGRAAIEAYFRQMPQEISVAVEQVVAGTDGRVVVGTVCRYPDGKQVCSAGLATPEEGKIARLELIEAWDE